MDAMRMGTRGAMGAKVPLEGQVMLRRARSVRVRTVAVAAAAECEAHTAPRRKKENENKTNGRPNQTRSAPPLDALPRPLLCTLLVELRSRSPP